MKQRVLLAAAGLVLLFGLFFFGKTAEKKPVVPLEKPEAESMMDVGRAIDSIKNELTPSQTIILQKLENGITRGDLKKQTAEQYTALADFWKDSVGSFIPYTYYLSKAAMLDNSEKKLTFAARLILENMKREDDPAQKVWEAQTAATLFERAIKLDPDNNDLKVGLGSCYVYGEGMIGNAEQTMKGIQQLLEVVRKDSNNMQAQLVLGIGGVISTQYNKAIERLKKVVDFDPHNLEAVSWLADAYAAAGDKQNAIKWYQQSEHLVNNPAFTKEINERIKVLKGNQ